MRELAAKIVLAAAPSRSIVLSVNNMSSLTVEEASSIEQDLRADLVAQGAVNTDPAATHVDVALSQNIDGFLWVVAIGAEPETKVITFKPAATRNPVEDESRAVPVLRRSILLRQQEPILDFAQTSTSVGQMLLLLEPEQILTLGYSGKDWHVNASAPIHHSQPWPRDLRGHIVISSSEGFEGFLPGVHCVGTFSPSLSVNCEESATAPWSAGNFYLSFVNARNYLSVSASSSSDLMEAYSTALFANRSAVIAGTDGIRRFWIDGALAVLPSAHWGDDIAPIASPCGTHEEIMVTASGDWTQRDHLQPFELAGSTASPSGDAIDFAGPITALWSSENGNSVRAISRNLETGLYEASIISISCGN